MSRLHVERNAARILISDDHPNGRLLLSSLIKRMGYEPLIAEDGESCIEQLGNHPVSLLLLDINMPKKDGFEVLAHTREHFPDTQVVMVTGSTQIESAVKALKMGAYDYLTKPVDSARLRATVENGLKVYNLRHQVSQLQTQLDQNELFADIIGQSNKLGKVFSLATQVIETDITVLILGESGTGKELLAQAIHQGSNRRQGPFVPVNCAAVPAQLADSLFLGHKKGAFTGASEDQVGYFEQAEGGTLFLDEVGDMDINLHQPFYLARAAMAKMTNQDGGGRIVLNGTESALHGGSAVSFPYAIAKRGTEAMVQGLAREGAPDGILVNGVRLGYIASGFHQRWHM